MRVEPHERDRAPIKEPTELPHPFRHVRTQPEVGRLNQEAGSHQTPTLLIPWSWASSLQTMRNKSLLFISPPVCDILLQQPEQTKKSTLGF